MKLKWLISVYMTGVFMKWENMDNKDISGIHVEER